MIEIVKIVIETYILLTLLIGFIAIAINKKSLVKMSATKQLLFFVLQPVLLIRELLRRKK